MRLIQIFEAKSYILKPFTLLDMELSHRVNGKFPYFDKIFLPLNIRPNWLVEAICPVGATPQIGPTAQ